MMSLNLSERYAATHGIPLEEVEGAVLSRCLPMPWGPLVRMLGIHRRPDTLRADRILVRQCLLARGVRDVRLEVEGFHYRDMAKVPSWRRILGIRVSGARLIELAIELFTR